jgi:hypothetical protein
MRNIAKYGIYWSIPGPNYHPHATVLYNCGSDRENEDGRLIRITDLINDVGNLTKQQPFKIQYIAIGELGYYGNVLNILRKIQLADL